ncbi:hypothetical protein [Dyella japonica]|uniref:hypothetical protein n=1 Tax=Dyella japonica TaxID=231455 RepID=UPI00138F8307|nr:hypothetical protein [Dyella japonica]
MPFDIYFKPAWTSSCSIAGGPSEIRFESASGDATNDDMQVMAAWPDGRSVDLGMKPGLFPPTEGSAGLDRGCKGIGVTVPNRQLVVLWLKRDDRPLNGRLALVLLDINRLRVLDVINNVGELIGDGPCLTHGGAGPYETVLYDGGADDDPNRRPRIMRIDVVGERLRLAWAGYVSKTTLLGGCFHP